MKIVRVKYERVFPIAPYINEKIGFEADLEGGDSPELTVEILRDLAQKSFNEKYPHVGEVHTNGIVFAKPEQDSYDGLKSNWYSADEAAMTSKPLSRTQSIINQINECSDTTVLKSFELLTRNNPEIKEAYQTKLESFK